MRTATVSSTSIKISVSVRFISKKDRLSPPVETETQFAGQLSFGLKGANIPEGLCRHAQTCKVYAPKRES